MIRKKLPIGIQTFRKIRESEHWLVGLDWRWLAAGGTFVGLLSGAVTLLSLDTGWESPWLLLVWVSMLAGLGWLGWDAEPRLARPLVELRPKRIARPRLVRDGPFDMVELSGGTFWMGSPETDDMAQEDEKPRHRVQVSGFRVARTPVTVALYREIMKETREVSGDDLPATSVSWLAAVAFCNRLSRRHGLTPCYHRRRLSIARLTSVDGLLGRGHDAWCCDWSANGYRLPTEAEREYACRAGTETRYSFSDDPERLGDFAWFRGNADGEVHLVARKRPNRWGLYDMHGNVWEWCWDRYGLYALGEQKDPTGPTKGGRRVLRGGSFINSPEALRSARRFGADPEFRGLDLGFRCVRVASPPALNPGSIGLLSSSERSEDRAVFELSFCCLFVCTNEQPSPESRGEGVPKR